MVKQVATEEEIQQKCLDFINHAEGHPKYIDQRERASINSEFEQGKQWTEEQYNRYKDVGIEPITINRCLAVIKTLNGLFIENMQDITIIPRKGGTETAARTLSEILKHCQDVGGMDIVQLTAFQKGNIQTASYIFMDINKNKSANGQIEFFAHGFFDVLIDPDCEDYDLDKKDTGAKYVILKKWMDKEELSALYDNIGDKTGKSNGTDGYYASAFGNSGVFYSEEEKKYRFCVYTIYWKESVEALLFGDKQTGETKILREDIAKYSAKIKGLKRFYTEKTTDFILHRSILINGKLVEDKPEPFGQKINFFPCVRYVPLYDKDYERGMLDDVISINKEENLRRTQVARLLNLTTNSGWEVNSVTDQKALEELKQFGSIPGYVVDKSKFGGDVKKIQPNQLSAGHLVLAQQSSEDMKEITQLNSAVQGYDKGTKDDPGVVLNIKRQQGMTANEGLFKHFRITLELLGNKLLSILDAMDIYTEEEIRAIITESHLIDKSMMQKAHDLIYSKIGTTLKPPMPIQPPPPEIMQQVPLEQMPEMFDTIQTGIKGAQIYAEQYPMLKDTFDKAIKEQAIRMLLMSIYTSEVTQYGVKVITSPQSQTARLANFAMMMSIQDKYGVIPPDLLLEYSDLPNKDEIISRIKANQMAMQQQPPQRPALQGNTA
jgi:hypothetical protein